MNYKKHAAQLISFIIYAHKFCQNRKLIIVKQLF